MSITFSAGEALELAVKNERNAAKFYRRAARLFPDAPRWDFLVKLAEMEDQHEKIFVALAAELSAAEQEPTAYDPMDEAVLFLDAMAAGHGGEGSSKAATGLTGRESMAEILHKAIRLEGRTILFFIGLRDLVPAKLGRGKVVRVLNEEKQHVVLLARQLRSLRA